MYTKISAYNIWIREHSKDNSIDIESVLTWIIAIIFFSAIFFVLFLISGIPNHIQSKFGTVISSSATDLTNSTQVSQVPSRTPSSISTTAPQFVPSSPPPSYGSISDHQPVQHIRLEIYYSMINDKKCV